jgi:hypothetical protein
MLILTSLIEPTFKDADYIRELPEQAVCGMEKLWAKRLGCRG